MIVYKDNQLIIHKLTLNEIKTNCFILQRGNDALLIDPTHKAKEIIKYLYNHKLTLIHMIATHGHFDHVEGAAEIIESLSAKALYLHEKDFKEIKNGPTYSRLLFKRTMRIPKLISFDLEILSLLKTWGLGISNAGGHTPGSSYIYDLSKKFIISGDLILNHKLKITMFNTRENTSELKNFYLKLKNEFSENTIIFPGHGDVTNLKTELALNYKINMLSD